MAHAACLFLLSLALPLHAQEGKSDSSAVASTDTVSALDLLRGNTPQAHRLARARLQILEGAMRQLESRMAGANLNFNIGADLMVPLVLSEEELQEITPLGPDPLGYELRRRYADIPSTANLNYILEGLARAFRTEPGKKIDTDLLVPTNLEIDILKQLWTVREATPSEIYARLDTSWRITAEDLQHALERMWQRGFLARKKISPSNEFSLFGIAGIEMSAKNRRNKVYLYWPVISRSKLITFLDAKRYLAYAEARMKASNGTDDYYLLLQNKLLRLLREAGDEEDERN